MRFDGLNEIIPLGIRQDIETLLGNQAMRILLIILGLLIVHSILRASTDRIVERIVHSHHYPSELEAMKREETLKSVFGASSTILLWIIGGTLILWQLDVNIGALLTGAGLVSVVAGLSAQSIIKDYLAGMFIIMENQYRVEDIVTLATPTATVSGTVEDISIRMTRLRDMDGNLHIISNGQIGVITNKSFQFANVNLNINVTYDTDIDLVEKLVNDAGKATAANKKLKDNIIEPIHFLRVESLNEANVTVKAFGQVRPGTQWEVSGEFRRQLKDRFVKHRIAVPYASTIITAPNGNTADK